MQLYEEKRKGKWAFYYKEGSTKYYLGLDEDDVVIAMAEPQHQFVWEKGDLIDLMIRHKHI